MNDRLPYEEQLAQQWNDLPLPDENMAWADMKSRLEEDDDDGIIPVWLRGCGLWGLVAVVLIGLGWWLVRPEKWWNKKQEIENVNTVDQKNSEKSNTAKINAADTSGKIKDTGEKKLNKNNKDVSIGSPVDSSLTTKTIKSNRVSQKTDDKIAAGSIPAASKRKRKNNEPPASKNKSTEKKQPVTKKPKTKTGNDKADISIQPGIKGKDTSNTVDIKDRPVAVVKDSASVIPVAVNTKDSVAKKTLPDSTSKKDSLPAAKTNQIKKDSSKSKTISFSAGLGMHQLVPIDGQKLTPYNSAGRKGSLADYIPSVFARLYKNDKWFLQLEFRYGAPQYTREILYKQKGIPDPLGSTITSTKLKKTFYHQLPVTFNYFLLPNWSLGGGFVWNKFNGAVSEQSVIRHTNATGSDSALGQPAILSSRKADSNFVKSYFQAVLETQFKWKRFSIGAKYSFGLQPYIKFNLPGGPPQQERNKSLQVFLRYELWKSKVKVKK